MSNYIESLSIEELVSLINEELTAGCSFTQVLPNTEIQRIILKALNWWYQNYYYAVQRGFFMINKDKIQEDTEINQKYITLPNEVQNVAWLFFTTDKVKLTLGVGQSNFSVGLGTVGNQPYLSSSVSTLADLAMNSVSIQNFSDMLDQLRLSTIKHDFSFQNKRLVILGGYNYQTNLIAECFIKIEQEYIFADAEFQEYATALCLKQMGMILTRYTYQLQGGLTINGDAILAEGKERETAVIERIKNLGNTSFMIMVKR